jgi:type IV secretion system protein VirB1
MDFAAMAKLCAPAVAPGLLQRIASVESSNNPFAIGVVGGRLTRQPSNASEALATASALKEGGWDFSVGLVQVNQKNFARYDLTPAAAFDPCTNLRVGGQILVDCYKRAGGTVTRMGDALSCYYAGNFTTGYRLGYVARVEQGRAGAQQIGAGIAIPVVAEIHRHSIRTSTASDRQLAPTDVFVSASAPPNGATATRDLSLSTSANPSALLF